MKGWLKRFALKQNLPLVFKDGRAFFDYQCRFGQTEIFPGRGIVALVSSADDPSDKTKDYFEYLQGRQAVNLRVAGSGNGFETFASVNKAGHRLKSGDVVIWVPNELNEKLVELLPDPRSGIFGVIAVQIAPQVSAAGEFIILHRYD